jgi:hypothetical protein
MIRNSKGDITYPCGLPTVMSIISELHPSLDFVEHCTLWRYDISTHNQMSQQICTEHFISEKEKGLRIPSVPKGRKALQAQAGIANQIVF